MNQGDLFQQDWHNCLRAHFEYVIREQDTLNERSLITVLNEVGYSTDDLLALREEISERLGLPAPVEEASEALDETSEPMDEVDMTTPVMASEAGSQIEEPTGAEVNPADAALEALPDEIEPDDLAQDEPPEPPEAPITQMSLF